MKILIALSLLPSVFRAWIAAIRVADAAYRLRENKRIVFVIHAE